MPESRPATRPMLFPCSPSQKPHPIMMSTIELGSSSGLRSISARRGIAARSSARMDFNAPRPARPMGVRMASTITASGIWGSLLGRWRAPARPATARAQILGDCGEKPGVALQVEAGDAELIEARVVGELVANGARHLVAQHL